jgi:RNA polymerase sigma-70 factor (ECF subfamily)
MADARVLDVWILALATEEERVRADDLGPIVARVTSGDPEALGPLYDALAPEIFAAALWRTGSRADAADVVQDVFVKIATAPGLLKGVKHPRRYVLTMAHRSAIDRHRGSRPDLPIDDALLVQTNELDAGRSLDAARATAALRELPDPQREAIYLHHFAGCSFREVGKITGVPTFTAASRHRLGIARLRVLLGGSR